MPQQQFNLAVGTAFAVLVRTFLGVAVGLAYVQLFWRTVCKAKKSLTLRELDWASAGMESVLSVLNVRIGWRFPLLVAPMVIYW